MITRLEIPFFKYLELNKTLPNPYFKQITRRHKKKYPFFYSMLSRQYSEQILSSRSFFITQPTLSEIESYLSSHEVQGIEFVSKTTIFSITIPVGNPINFFSHLFIITPVNQSLVVDILTYNNSEFNSWLSGVFEGPEKMHISLSYNLEEGGSIYLINLFQFILHLFSIKKFDRVTATLHESEVEKAAIVHDIESLTIIDLSYIREYIIPTMNRKGHYRWQLCGPGRSILRHIKVKPTIVKRHIRKGKRSAIN